MNTAGTEPSPPLSCVGMILAFCCGGLAAASHDEDSFRGHPLTTPKLIIPDGADQHNTAVCAHVTIRMRFAGGKRKEAQDILASLIERVKIEEGCLSCCLYQDALETNTLMFEAAWSDEENLKKHLRSDEFRKALLVVEMAIEPPEIRFGRIACPTGKRTIEEVLR